MKSLIADRRVLSNGPLKNCGTHFGFSPLLVSKATNDKRFRILLYITHGKKMIVLSVPIYARYRLSGIFRQKTRLHQPRRSKFYLHLWRDCKIWISPSVTSLRGRRSKGKGKGIRARDHARGRSDSCFPRAPKSPLPLPLLTPATQAKASLACWANRRYFATSPLVSPQKDVWGTSEKKFHTDDVSLPRYGSCFWLVVLQGNLLQPIRSTTQICVVTSSKWNFCARSSHVNRTKKLIILHLTRNPYEFLILLSNILLPVVAWNAWNDHVLDWWKHKDDPNVLFLKYEDLHKVMLQFPSN